MTIQTHWLAFYADRFIKETSQLNPFEVAAYYRLFESYAQTGYLVDDPYMLADIAKLNSALPEFRAQTGVRPDRAVWSEFIDSTISSLLARFFELAPDGTYHHHGWDAELAKAATKYEARAKGGHSRWDKATTVETGNETDNHSDIDNQNGNKQPEQEELTTRARTSELSAQHIAEHKAKLSPSLLEDKDESTDKGKAPGQDTDQPEEPASPNNGLIAPEATALARELTHESCGKISFLDKHKIRLSETLKEFTAEEITEVFEDWQDTQTGEELETYGAGQFVQIVGDKCYALRREKEEREEYQKEMDAQTEAEQVRRAAEAKRREEESSFDLLADVLCVSA